MKPRCYIYDRVSTSGQAISGYSIDSQERVCNEYAKGLGYDVNDIFIEEGKTAKNTNRPKYQELFKALEEKPVEAIVIYKIDRFFRNVGDFASTRKVLKERGIKLLSVVEGDVSEGLVGNIFAAVAEWESETNGMRTIAALKEKFLTGWWVGWAPLGYDNNRDDNNQGIITTNSEVGPIIKWAFEQYSTGNYSLLKLTEMLNKKGIKTKSGNPIAHNTIHQILTNPFYYGLMRYHIKKGQGETMEAIGKHQPLISKKLFDTCQFMLAKRRNFVVRERKHDFLLRGLVFCSQCGQRYTAEWHTTQSKNNNKIAYYHCAKLKKCKSKYVDSIELEKKVNKLLKGIKFTKEFTNAVTRQVQKFLKGKNKEQSTIRQSYLNKRNALVTKRTVLEDRLLDNTIDRDTFKRKQVELQSGINELDGELSRLELNRTFDFDVLEEVLALTRNIPKAYSQAPDFLKKKYLHFFFDQIMVDNKNIENTAFSPLVNELIEAQKIILRKNWLLGHDSNVQP